MFNCRRVVKKHKKYNNLIINELSYHTFFTTTKIHNILITMKTYISILRGINVSGQKKILMTDLKALYESLGCVNVKTYIQSGNVIFDYDDIISSHIQEFQEKILQKIEEIYNFRVPIIIKTIDELENIMKKNPFIDGGIPIDKVHVSFLSETPTKDNIDKLTGMNFEPDEYKIIGTVIYLYCPNGYGNTKLSNNFFENKLKVVATTRNWKTTNELFNIAKINKE